MNENLPPDFAPQESPAPKARGTGFSFIIGAIAGAAAELIISPIMKTPIKLKSVLRLAAIVGVVNAAVNWVFAPKEPPAAQPPAPPAPPAPPVPTEPQGMALSAVPQILDLLVQQGALSAQQQTAVLTSIQQGQPGYAGEIAIEKGFISREQFEKALLAQSASKAEAAIIDISQMAQGIPLAAPAWLRSNWGNNGVNPAAASPSRADGAAAAANIAQNLTLLAGASQDPRLASILIEGAVAAVNLTRGITQGNSARVPLASMNEEWRTTVNAALTAAAQAAPQTIVDSKGTPIDINQFIAARHAEINAGVTQALAAAPGKDQGQTR